jgi:hypothetical protein
MADDGMNAIIIRGNSPTGLLWKMKAWTFPILIILPKREIVEAVFLFQRNRFPTDFVTAAFAANMEMR